MLQQCMVLYGSARRWCHRGCLPHISERTWQEDGIKGRPVGISQSKGLLDLLERPVCSSAAT